MKRTVFVIACATILSTVSACKTVSVTNDYEPVYLTDQERACLRDITTLTIDGNNAVWLDSH